MIHNQSNTFPIRKLIDYTKEKRPDEYCDHEIQKLNQTPLFIYSDAFARTRSEKIDSSMLKTTSTQATQFGQIKKKKNQSRSLSEFGQIKKKKNQSRSLSEFGGRFSSMPSLDNEDDAVKFFLKIPPKARRQKSTSNLEKFSRKHTFLMMLNEEQKSSKNATFINDQRLQGELTQKGNIFLMMLNEQQKSSKNTTFINDQRLQGELTRKIGRKRSLISNVLRRDSCSNVTFSMKTPTENVSRRQSCGNAPFSMRSQTNEKDEFVKSFLNVPPKVNRRNSTSFFEISSEKDSLMKIIGDPVIFPPSNFLMESTSGMQKGLVSRKIGCRRSLGKNVLRREDSSKSCF